MQLTKEILFPGIKELKDCLEACIYVIPQIMVEQDLLTDIKYKDLFSVEKVNQYVLSGISFRDAYKKVAEELGNGTFTPPLELHHTHLGSIGNLANDQIKTQMQEVIKKLNK